MFYDFSYVLKVSGISSRLMVSGPYLWVDVTSSSEHNMNSPAEMLEFLSYFPVVFIMVKLHHGFV